MTTRMQTQPVTDATRDELVAWLRDAHALEGQAIEIIERQLDRLENYPQLAGRLRQHLEETRVQRERVEQCLTRLGSDASSFKEGMMKLTGNMQALMQSGSGDEVLKAGISNYAFEATEIASYTELVAAAEVLGEAEIARLCRENLAEEKAMAEWIEQHLPELTQTYLSRLETGGGAKR